jgi:hypothetical protein
MENAKEAFSGGAAPANGLREEAESGQWHAVGDDGSERVESGNF